MKRLQIRRIPLQLDFWDTNNSNVISMWDTAPLDLDDPYWSADAIRNRKLACLARIARREEFREWLYDHRFLAPQVGLCCFKRDGKIIVQRIGLSGKALQQRMQKMGLRVIG
jgi:hypothetical protein